MQLTFSISSILHGDVRGRKDDMNGLFKYIWQTTVGTINSIQEKPRNRGDKDDINGSVTVVVKR